MKQGTPIRHHTLTDHIVVVDGVSGAGKTMVAHIVSSMDRVEKMQYSPDLEHVLEYNHMEHITDEATIEFIRMHFDMLLYNQMQGRNMNIRFSDLSSVWQSPKKWKYLKRLISKGDMKVPDTIAMQRPILHLETHHILSYAHPLVKAFPQVVFIEVVRHPLYCLKQQALNWQRLQDTPRNFNLHIKSGNKQVPFTFLGFEHMFEGSNDTEKAIYEMSLLKRMELLRTESIDVRTITIPFEKFIQVPKPDIEFIATRLQTKTSSLTWEELKRQKLPTKLFTSGRDAPIFRRVGWEPPEKGATQEKEYIKLWNWAKDNADLSAMNVLEQLCRDYEEKWQIKFVQ